MMPREVGDRQGALEAPREVVESRMALVARRPHMQPELEESLALQRFLTNT